MTARERRRHQIFGGIVGRTKLRNNKLVRLVVRATAEEVSNGVIGNFYGLLQSASAVLESAADNEVRGNGTAVIGSITTPSCGCRIVAAPFCLG